MGIVSSTFASLAIGFAWNFQRFLDPRYRYIETTTNVGSNNGMTIDKTRSKINAESNVDSGAVVVVSSTGPSATTSTTTTRRKLTSLEYHQVASAICLPAVTNNSLHQENRHRRAAQHRYRKRPSSFDVSLIVRNKNKSYSTKTSGLVTTSTPSTLMRQPAPSWESTSSSGCSTDSSDDSEIEFMYAPRPVVPTSNNRLNHEKSSFERQDVTNDNNKKPDITKTHSINGDNEPAEECAMSAAEEAAFRMTIGRGHFTRSKKDRFLNNLRLEKRLNGLNKEFFELECRAHTRSLRRRHSGDLRRIV